MQRIEHSSSVGGRPLRRLSGFTLIEIMIVVAIVGILAALVIPNFIQYQARSKQTEAKTNLKSIFQGQKSFFAAKDRYSNAAGDIGFAPERGNRYAYNLSGVAMTAATAESRATAIAAPGTTLTGGFSVDTYRYSTDAQFPAAPAGGGAVTWNITISGVTPPSNPVGGIFGTCPNCSFTASAIGNIDNEGVGLDFMSVSSEFADVTLSTCSRFQANITPGEPAQVYNDISCNLP